MSWKDILYNEGLSDDRCNEPLGCGYTYQYSKQELVAIFNRVGLHIGKYNLLDDNNHNFVLVRQ